MSNWFLNNFIEIFGTVTGIIYVFLEIRQNSWLWPLGLATAAAYVIIFFRSKLYADMSLQTYYVVISVLGWYWWIRGSGLRAQGAGRRKEGEKGRRGESSFAKATEDKGENGRGGEVLIAQSSEQEAVEMESGVYYVDSPLEGGQGDVFNIEINESETEAVGLNVTRIKARLAIILFVIFLIIWAAMYNVLSRLTDSPVPGWDAFITSLSVVGTWMLARKLYEHWYLWIVVNLVSVILYFTRGLYLTVILYFIYLTMSFIGLKAWKKSLEAESSS
jgi:nicotinamide mononucleotide transporter